ncbi:hypothetical protein HYP71_gp053 [Arthrobacter phage KBurrousTX]|uniref:Uncharacterized protein n=1 Tax=Arthrobacter phage KBurrousTX TaxID=2315608 RepID=A0A386K928_9CAUD|nr:hypothetical protein HYP71_gp053 [Arthrobacter phage KBurrousTX]AYD81547.1 hypothetical protein KBurrousTX_53 [Arthrobacter phage KBurrousTX]
MTTNAQAALLAAATVHKGRKTPPAAVKLLAESFKNWLDWQDTQQAEADKAALIQIYPGYCLQHLKDQYASYWGPPDGHLAVRLINPGEQCNTRECFQDDPTNPHARKATDK